MTSPIETITVRCPGCQHEYEDWYRASMNLGMDDFDDDYIRRASTATCPKCGHVVNLGVLVVDGEGVWRVG